MNHPRAPRPEPVVYVCDPADRRWNEPGPADRGRIGMPTICGLIVAGVVNAVAIDGIFRAGAGLLALFGWR